MSVRLRFAQVEIKNTIKNLKKEAEMRLTLDVEAQQSFDFLSDQVQGLRKAFSTLSDVLIEEVDLIRAEASDRQEEQQHRNEALSKALKVQYSSPLHTSRQAYKASASRPLAQATKTEITLLRSEAQAARVTLQTKANALEERIELLQVPPCDPEPHRPSEQVCLTLSGFI